MYSREHSAHNGNKRRPDCRYGSTGIPLRGCTGGTTRHLTTPWIFRRLLGSPFGRRISSAVVQSPLRRCSRTRAQLGAPQGMALRNCSKDTSSRRLYIWWSPLPVLYSAKPHEFWSCPSETEIFSWLLRFCRSPDLQIHPLKQVEIHRHSIHRTVHASRSVLPAISNICSDNKDCRSCLCKEKILKNIEIRKNPR